MIEIQKERENQFIFKFKTEKGRTLMNSVKFKSEAELKTTIDHLVSPHQRTRFERTTNHGGEFQFRLKNLNGKLIGNSLSYSSEAGMENGIKNLQNSILQFSETKKL